MTAAARSLRIPISHLFRGVKRWGGYYAGLIDGMLTPDVRQMSGSFAQSAGTMFKAAHRFSAPLTTLFGGLALLCLAGGMAEADMLGEQPDHDRARAAMERGEIKPLVDILALTRDRLHGQLIEIELEQIGERWVYEFEMIQPNGEVIEYYVDGGTGEFVDEAVKR
jgi:uncharacterized membrane protein YkoI